MLISFMSIFSKFKILLKFTLGEGGKHQDMLTHSHVIELFILICKEVKKIYRDHSYHPKIPLHGIAVLIYITQHPYWLKIFSLTDLHI